jgi:outer membrane protein OmpA-like peptidoglycan-associated protein
MDAEDKDGFEDTDGCPDKDNDQDGILDKDDKCPTIPETVNQLDDTDGCPDFVTVTDDHIVLSLSVFFDKKNTAVLDRSQPMLEEAASIMKLKPDLKIRIESYTDNALPKAASLKASKQQADTVKASLIKFGVDVSRLTTEGFGQDKPIADNKTKAGREKNNRIELVIEK